MAYILKSNVGLESFEVLENEVCADNLMYMRIYAPQASQSMAPGQFVSLLPKAETTSVTRIPLSPATINASEKTLSLVYAKVGVGTRALAEMRKGDVSSLVGPSGVGWRFDGVKRALLIAGGVGAPPILCAAKALVDRGSRISIVLGARTKDALWGEDIVKSLAHDLVYVATDDGSYGERGFTTDVAARLLQDDTYDCIYSCGPTPMMAGVAKLAQTSDVDCQVSLEKMMSCGFGACNTCNVLMRDGTYKSCCMEGPVFMAKELAWAQ